MMALLALKRDDRLPMIPGLECTAVCCRASKRAVAEVLQLRSKVLLVNPTI